MQRSGMVSEIKKINIVWRRSGVIQWTVGSWAVLLTSRERPKRRAMKRPREAAYEFKVESTPGALRGDAMLVDRSRVQTGLFV